MCFRSRLLKLPNRVEDQKRFKTSKSACPVKNLHLSPPSLLSFVIQLLAMLELLTDPFVAPYNFNGYPAIKGLSHFFRPLFNNAVEGTGITFILAFTQNITGKDVPDVFLKYAVSFQNSLFGDYPVKSDIAPSIAFAVIFGVLGFIHLFIFLINYSRGHYFWISFVWFLNCIFVLIGYALRAKWSTDIKLLQMGLASEIFLIIPSIVFVSFDLILAQRLFTWRHPVGGSRWLFWNIMFSLYGAVAFLIAITIVASFVPYIYKLSSKSWTQWKQVVQATSILVIAYSLTSLSLIALSYLFPPTAKDENLYTYQPWWIESFSPFYFVQPGAAQAAEETFMKRNHNHRHAIRVIAATHHHYNMVEGLTNQRGNLEHNVSMLLILVTTVLIFIGALFRCIVCFENKIQRHGGPLTKNYVMYIVWGGFEAIINVMYIIGRVDLRFYRPDTLPAKVKAIITAEQSYFPSDNEDNDDADAMSSRTGTYSTVSDKSYPRAPSPPYPRDDILREKNAHDDDDDNLSDFHF